MILNGDMVSISTESNYGSNAVLVSLTMAVSVENFHSLKEAEFIEIKKAFTGNTGVSISVIIRPESKPSPLQPAPEIHKPQSNTPERGSW